MTAAAIFLLCRSRHFRLAMLMFQLVWLNAIVPGHHRGVVMLPGTHCESCEAEGAPASQPACPSDSKSSHRPPGDPATHCAICFFAARLSPAVAYDFTHPPLRLVAVIDARPAPSAVDIHLILPYRGRAPPAEA